MRRTLQAIPLLILISMIIYGILDKAPGGPLAPYLQNPHITAADIDRLKHNLGLDQPLPLRYVFWLGHVVTGDFGYSTSNSESVIDALKDRFPATVLLMAVSFGLALLVGIAAGTFSAVKPYSFADYAITTLAFFGQSMPVFWFALMMQLAFAVHGIPLPGGYKIQLPSAGLSSSDVNLNDVFYHPWDLGAWGQLLSNAPDIATHLILPSIVLALLNLALFSRFMRSSMLEVLKTDYIRTASAKGLSFRAVLSGHAFKNALIPIVTVTALTLPSLFAGAVVTETIFSWPGMGRLFIGAIGQQDIALLMGYLVIVAALVVFCNLLADIAYAWLDPRVKYD